jgi:hypothetical protein
MPEHTEPQLPEVNAEQYFVIDAETTTQIMNYLLNSPYGQVKDFADKFATSKRLKEFLKGNKIEGIEEKS